MYSIYVMYYYIYIGQHMGCIAVTEQMYLLLCTMLVLHFLSWESRGMFATLESGRHAPLIPLKVCDLYYLSIPHPHVWYIAVFV